MSTRRVSITISPIWAERWHPDVHALVTPRGWDREGVWTPVPFVDGKATALLFRRKVLDFLKRGGPLAQERARLLLSLRHPGFSVHTSVTVPPGDADGLEHLPQPPSPGPARPPPWTEPSTALSCPKVRKEILVPYSRRTRRSCGLQEPRKENRR
jgi:hypothetical protein